MSKPLLQLFGVGRELVQSQTATASALQSSTNDIENGEIISTTLVSGSNTLSHRLGRSPVGAILVAGDAAQYLVLTGGTSTTAEVDSSDAVVGAKVLVF
jgi:hypothetical protein